MDLILLNQPRVFPRQSLYARTKRVLDFTLCLAVMPFVLPIIAICALAIALDSDGPVFFIQERIGRGGHPFRMFKFRTMRIDLDDKHGRAFMKAYVRGEVEVDEIGNKSFKPVRPNQITRVGRILRKTSLDELPQLINVLKGEMSIVGPRPNVTWEVEEYRSWHHERLEVLPGITGLAQVRGRSCIDFNTLVRNDIEYIEKRNLALDIKIFWWSIMAVITYKGAG
jgi:lipopolysaccharide/colanic/teichoic acid biosynthesis glycosyltransferase